MSLVETYWWHAPWAEVYCYIHSEVELDGVYRCFECNHAYQEEPTGDYCSECLHDFIF